VISHCVRWESNLKCTQRYLRDWNQLTGILCGKDVNFGQSWTCEISLAADGGLSSG